MSKLNHAIDDALDTFALALVQDRYRPPTTQVLPLFGWNATQRTFDETRATQSMPLAAYWERLWRLSDLQRVLSKRQMPRSDKFGLHYVRAVLTKLHVDEYVNDVYLANGCDPHLLIHGILSGFCSDDQQLEVQALHLFKVWTGQRLLAWANLDDDRYNKTLSVMTNTFFGEHWDALYGPVTRNNVAAVLAGVLSMRPPIAPCLLPTQETTPPVSLPDDLAGRFV